MAKNTEVRVAADVGGTFTDIVCVTPSEVVVRKLLSTPPHYEQAVARGISALGEVHKLEFGAVSAFRHASTVATNTILEHVGACTALLTTRGFRDVLEIGRLRRPDVFDIRWRKPSPLVPRRRRFEITERVDHVGEVLEPCRLQEVEALVSELRTSAVESIAVAFINSYVNPVNERAVAEVLRRRLPGVSVSLSSDVLPEVREYERTSTTVVNAYIRPVVDSYIGDLRSAVERAGVCPELQVMQSNGGLTSGTHAGMYPVRTVESGPAAGAIAAAHLARRLDARRVLAFDMGGTTAKASLITDGTPSEVTQLEVGAGMNANRLSTGGGYVVRTPSLDIVEVGGGGGSICWIDSVGRPHVGPESAGANPGPVCYGMGGERVTVTDANIVLGYLNPEQIAGGSQAVDRDLAIHAVDIQVARPLGLSVAEAALGVVRLVNANMGRALRAVSIERGLDPRDHVLMAFGGAGPMHAVQMARQFDISRVIIPPWPGLFSALGLLVARSRHDEVRAYGDRGQVDPTAVCALLADAERTARAALADDVDADHMITTHRRLDLSYAGQSFELQVAIGSGEFGPQEWEEAVLGFHRQYAQTYGHSEPDDPVQLVNVRVSARASDNDVADAVWDAVVSAACSGESAERKEREAYFGMDGGWTPTAVVGRAELGSDPAEGPIIVEDMDATTVIPPGSSVHRDDDGNLVVALADGDRWSQA